MNYREAILSFDYIKDDPRKLLQHLNTVENDSNLVFLTLDRVSVDLEIWVIIIDRLLNTIKPTREMFEHLLIIDMDHYLSPIFHVFMKHHCPANVDSEFMRSALLYQPEDVSIYMIDSGADIPVLNMPLSDNLRRALILKNPMVVIPQLYSNFSKEKQQIFITFILVNKHLFIYLPPELMFEIFRHL